MVLVDLNTMILAACKDAMHTPEELNRMLNWYTVRCISQRETRSELRLRECGYETYQPRYERDRSGARYTSEKYTTALFPGYFFLHTHRPGLTPRERGWDILNLLSQAVPDQAIEELKQRESNGIIRLPEPFEPGAAIELVSDDSFFGQRGLYQGMTDDDRVSVLLTMLGRSFTRIVSRSAVREFAHA